MAMSATAVLPSVKVIYFHLNKAESNWLHPAMFSYGVARSSKGVIGLRILPGKWMMSANMSSVSAWALSSPGTGKWLPKTWNWAWTPSSSFNPNLSIFVFIYSGIYWLSERSLRFDKIGNLFFRQMSVWMPVCQFRSRGHSFQAILMERGTCVPWLLA